MTRQAKGSNKEPCETAKSRKTDSLFIVIGCAEQVAVKL